MVDKPSFWKSAQIVFIVVGVVALVAYMITLFLMWVFDAGMERIIPGPYAIPLVAAAAAILFVFIFAMWKEECNTAKAEGERDEHWHKLQVMEGERDKAHAFIKRYVPQENITEHLQDLEATRSQRMTALLNVLEKGPVEEIERSTKAVDAHLESVRVLRVAVLDTEVEIKEATKLATAQGFTTDSEQWRAVAEEKEVRQETTE